MPPRTVPEDGPRPGGTVLGGLAALGFALPVAAYFWLIHHYAVNTVFLDQWSDVDLVGRSYSGRLTFGALWAQHSEHRMLIPNLVVVMLGRTLHLDIVLEEYLSALLLCLAALLIIWAHKRRSPSLPWIVYCPVALLMLSLVQSESTLFGFQLAWYLVLFMLAAALFLLDGRVLSGLALGGAIAAAVLGSFSSLQGLLIWPVGLLLLYHRRRPWSQVLIWSLAAALTLIAYTHRFNSQEGVPSYLSGLHLPGAAVRSFFQVIGDVLGVHLSTDSGVGNAIEIFGVLIFLIAISAAVTRGVRRDDSSGAPIGVALICFGILYAVGFAYGRAFAGPGTASASQYTTYTLLIVVGSYLALLGPPLKRRSPRSLTRHAHCGVRALLIAAIGLQLAFGSVDGIRVASNFHRTQVRAAVVTAGIDKVPDALLASSLGTSGLPPALVRSYARVLEVHRLSLYDSSAISSYERTAQADQKRGLFSYTPPPVTEVLRPFDNQVLTGRVTLDAGVRPGVRAAGVGFVLAGTDGQEMELGAAKVTYSGWLLHWNTTSVANGRYRLQSVLSGTQGTATRSAPITVTVQN
jgi:hypothetical protein